MSSSKMISLTKGNLIITSSNVYGLEEKWFFNEKYKNVTIYDNDNIFIPKHTVGIFISYIDWIIPAVNVCWGGDLKGKNLIVSLGKIKLLDKFIEELDENE